MKQGWIQIAVITAVLTAGICRAAESAAQPTPPDQDGWQFFMPTYLWMPGIDGDMTAKGRTADVSVDPQDVFDHTDVGIILYLEVRKQKYGFFIEPFYTVLSADSSGTSNFGDTRSVDLELEQWIATGGGFYQLVHTGGDKPLTLDVMAGARWWSMKNTLTFKGPIIGRVQGTDTTEFLDPYVGFRARQYLTRKLFVAVRGDVGGFDLSDDCSDLSWQALGLVGYDFNQYFTLHAGYRALAGDYDEGGGANKTSVDVVLHGAMIGFDFDLFGWWKNRR
jgi:hypothetical protein